jgi:hypothetical protein
MGLSEFIKEVTKLPDRIHFEDFPLTLIARKIGTEKEIAEHYLKFLIATRLIVYGNGMFDISQLKTFTKELEKIAKEQGKDKAKQIYEKTKKEWKTSLKNFWIKNWYLAPLSAVVENAYKEKPLYSFFKKQLQNLKDKPDLLQQQPQQNESEKKKIKRLR